MQANENNGSTDPSLNKGDWTHGATSNRIAEANIFSCSAPSYTYSNLNTYQQPFEYGKMGSIEQKSHFKKIQNFKADYTEAEFTQYESQRTGMRAVVVDRKGPKVCLPVNKLAI